MNISFETVFRAEFPEPKNPKLSSLWLFNIYRAGSSVVEALALAYANLTGRTPNNVTRVLYDSSVEYFDTHEVGKSRIHLGDDGAPLLKLCAAPGLLHYGFREVPIGFARGFRDIGRSVLVARDPRDIGISHYAAVHRHTTADPMFANRILKLRQMVEETSLEDYLLDPSTLSFLRRITMCYAPMVSSGMRVIRYEDLYQRGAFSLEVLSKQVSSAWAEGWGSAPDSRRLSSLVERLVSQSDSLVGHATSGKTGLWRHLPERVQTALAQELEEPIRLLNYPLDAASASEYVGLSS